MNEYVCYSCNETMECVYGSGICSDCADLKEDLDNESD